tara:strand:- start:146 stop:475 length:330 start_codon:yes stop_codon:yes gene_type:complete
MNSETSPSQEFLDDMEKYGVKNWTDPRAFYDYHSAWTAGERPTWREDSEDPEGGYWKWSSKWKHPLSHERYINDGGILIDTITGKEATEEDKIMNDIKREEFLKDFTNF